MYRNEADHLSSACMTLAADARLSTVNYLDDQIWEIVPGTGEPASLCLQTTYGLRARWMRLFPRFNYKQTEYTNPLLFHQPVTCRKNYPNYLSLEFTPSQGFQIQADYWAPESHTIAGRLRFRNVGVLPEPIRFEWVALLNPSANGEPMAPVKAGGGFIMEGISGGLYPVCVISKQSVPVYSPYPALSLEFTLFPGDVQDVFWALATLSEAVQSRTLAEQTLKRNWDAEYARVEMENERRRISVFTGNPDWDRVFALSQKVAGSLVLSSGPSLPYPSFVLNRTPDFGYSPRQDGLDHPFSWQGQDALSAYYLAGILLPGNIDLVVGILNNFLVGAKSGQLPDWKPGLAGQRSGWLAFPILASLAERIDRFQDDSRWLEDIYSPLVHLIDAWFSSQHDQDQDGWPEWTNSLQAGLDNVPLFSRSQPNGESVPINTVETPLLAALLYHECRCLVKLASKVEDGKTIPSLEKRMRQLEARMEDAWDERNGLYRYRDALSHQVPEARNLAEKNGSGSIEMDCRLDFPQTLLITLRRKTGTSVTPVIKLVGECNGTATEEEIRATDYSWFDDHFFHRTKKEYDRLYQVILNGLDSADQFSLRTINYHHQDISQLVPLWSGIMDKAKVRKMLRTNLSNKFLGENGISLAPVEEWDLGDPALAQVILPWNLLIAEGMLANGERLRAADLVSRIMKGIILSLRTVGCFKESYHAQENRPAGNRNSLAGLAPLGLFLESLGLEKISKEEIIISGYNPYPHPVTVQYAGITILCEAERVQVTWPSGEVQQHKGPIPFQVRFPTAEGE